MNPSISIQDTTALAPGLRAAITRAADTAYWYHSKSLGRAFGGDTIRAAEYEGRSKAYTAALGRLEDYADRLGLLRRCCTSGEDCFHNA